MSKITYTTLLIRINRQNEMIANAHRTVAETEEVGMEITSELARNREKIESARTKVHLFILISFFGVCSLPCCGGCFFSCLL